MIQYLYRAISGLLLVAALDIAAPALGAELPKPQPALSPSQPGSLPRAEAQFAAARVYRERMLTEDTVWRGEVLVEGVLTVAPQATLTVEPGTVVRFRRIGAQAPLLVVQGRILATGTSEAPILFTSVFGAPLPSDWQGVMLLGSEKRNLMENCRIEGAQTGVEALFSVLALKNVRGERSGTGMRFQDAVVTLEGGGASGCDTGLSFTDSEATLRGVTAEGNRLGIWGRRSSLHLSDSVLSGNSGPALTVDNCRLRFQGGTIVGNRSGLTATDSEGGIVGARVIKNREHGVSLSGSRLRVNANQVSGNGGHGILVFDGSSVAWGNAIHDNAGYDLYNSGIEEFRAPGNWWGNSAPRIFENGGRGKVLYAPTLPAKPWNE